MVSPLASCSSFNLLFSYSFALQWIHRFTASKPFRRAQEWDDAIGFLRRARLAPAARGAPVRAPVFDASSWAPRRIYGLNDDMKYLTRGEENVNGQRVFVLGRGLRRTEGLQEGGGACKVGADQATLEKSRTRKPREWLRGSVDLFQRNPRLGDLFFILNAFGLWDMEPFSLELPGSRGPAIWRRRRWWRTSGRR